MCVCVCTLRFDSMWAMKNGNGCNSTATTKLYVPSTICRVAHVSLLSFFLLSLTSRYFLSVSLVARTLSHALIRSRFFFFIIGFFMHVTHIIISFFETNNKIAGFTLHYGYLNKEMEVDFVSASFFFCCSRSHNAGRYKSTTLREREK